MLGKSDKSLVVAVGYWGWTTVSFGILVLSATRGQCRCSRVLGSRFGLFLSLIQCLDPVFEADQPVRQPVRQRRWKDSVFGTKGITIPIGPSHDFSIGSQNDSARSLIAFYARETYDQVSSTNVEISVWVL